MNHFLHGTDLAWTDETRAALKLNAEFAVRLVNHLESELDLHLEEQPQPSPRRHVANTCQIAEGLHAIAIPQITAPLIERALNWLVTLNLYSHSSDEEVLSARLHPSRFKTLAQMGRLDTETATLQEFRELSKGVTANDGVLHDTPVSSLSLATMIWLDTLAHLKMRGWDIGRYRKRSLCAYRTCATLYTEWLHPNGARDKTNGKTPRAKPDSKRAADNKLCLNNPADASYALDLLLRHSDLTPKHAATRDGQIKLVAALKNRKRNDWRNYDSLYCAIQLATYFRDDAQVQETILELLTELRATFGVFSAEQALPLAALSLRLLGTFYGSALSNEIIKDQWRFQREQERKTEEARTQEQNTELAKLLRETFEIEIGAKELLSNPHSENQVWRVRFGFQASGVDDYEQHPRASKNALRIILKQGTVSSLENAVTMYRSLSPALQSYFAEHVSTNQTAQSSDQSAYMVMRDLAEMELLADIYQRFDRTLLEAEDKRNLVQSARQVALAFHALHHEPYPAKGATNQLERLYLTPLTASIDQVCATSFPTLRDFVEGGFDAGSAKYKPLAYYLNELRKREEKIRPVKLGKIHGDAHSRNLMLDSAWQRVKFIDVEYFADDRDYLADYALLLEDIAFYQYLPHRRETARLRFDQFNHTLSGKEPATRDALPLTRPQNVSPRAERAHKEKSIRNAIQYPLLPIDSEAALLFQQTLLTQLKGFADSIGDSNWKARLWLAIAQALLLLLERQARSQSFKGIERDILNLALVIYAEAVRLLDELVANLMWQWPLPELPFRGARATSYEIDDRALSRQVLRLFDELPNVTRKQNPDVKPWLEFFIPTQLSPFAEFHNISKEYSMELILHAPLAQLTDTENLIATRSPDGGLVIPKSRLANHPALRALVRQAYEYALTLRHA